MLSYRTYGCYGPTIVLLHWLGGSARTWTEITSILAERGMRALAIDLPGFGDSVDNSNHSVQSMADDVLATLCALNPTQFSTGWLLGGHSMGGKVATVLTRSLLDDSSTISMPTGLILVSPSPPGPEPMKGSKRKEMLDSLGRSTGDADEDRKRAASYVAGNVGKLPIEPATNVRTEDDVLRMSRQAFAAWLIDINGHPAGSKEDWSKRVGILPIPTIIFAGTEDAALGPDAQREHTLTHFSHGELIPLAACGHLGPIERPTELAEHFLSFAQSLGLIPRPPAEPFSQQFQHVIDSQRTSPQTRSVLLARLPEPFVAPRIFSETELRTLRALIDIVIPHASRNIAARLNQTLAQPRADGWRFNDLPDDVTAWRQGFSSLDAAAHRTHGVSFLALSPSLRRALLVAAQQGNLGRGPLGILHLGESADAFSASQMQKWFEDVRAELTRLYISDPRTLDRIGFTGFADDPSGFTQIRLEDQHETREELTGRAQ